jgi:lactate dehydrogenase-like 2-hydroxyacid dehydrogenase
MLSGPDEAEDRPGGTVERPAILKTCVFQVPAVEQRVYDSFEAHDWPAEPAARDDLLARVGPRIRGIATDSKGPVTEAMLAKLPALEIVSSWSAGREGIDVAALGRRGIPFFDTSEILASDVADMAMALMLAVMRRIVVLDRYARSGRWASEGRHAYVNRVSGKRLGIVGLGQIGRGVAARAQAFGMQVAYTGPRRKAEAPYPFLPSTRALAEWCDVLVLACAGGEATRHLVDAEVLDALGPDGWLVNVARGTVVDQAALIAALEAGRIGGAGLDVLETEPVVPPALAASDRVVLTPHHGSSTLETKVLQGTALVDRLVEALYPA